MRVVLEASKQRIIDVQKFQRQFIHPEKFTSLEIGNVKQQGTNFASRHCTRMR